MSKNLPSVPQAAQKKPNKKLLLEVARQRDLAKNVIFPLLLKHATSIKNAENMCKTLMVGMDASFMKDIKEYQTKRSDETLETLGLLSLMKKSKEFAGEREIIEALNGEKISDAKGMMQGMEEEIKRLVAKELVSRPLAELKTEFL